MWIVLGIIGFLAILITAITLLPVKIIIKNDAHDPLILRYRFLFKTFGENPDPNDPITRALKTATGVSRLEREALEKNVQDGGLKKTVTDNYNLLVDLLKEVVALLKHCTITTLHVKILCTGEDAADAAIHYGQSCAATQTLLSILDNFLKIRKRGCKVDISCDFFGDEPLFRYYVVLSFRTGRVLKGLWKAAMAEAKRMGLPQENQEK